MTLMTDTPTIAFLGTGTMGQGMIRRLLGAGLSVRAWNRTRAKAEPLAADGASVHDTAVQAVDGADIVITMLMDDRSVAEVVAPALSGFSPTAVWLQMSTVGVEGNQRLAELAARRGVAYVDAPVLGTRKPAADGTLKILASGPADVLAALAPVFAPMGTVFEGLGEAGVGSRLKLVANAWILSLTDAVATSVHLAQSFGLDPQLFLDVVAGSLSDTPYLQLKGKAVLGADYTPSFSLAAAAKDAALVVADGRAAGYEATLTAAVLAHMRRAIERGHGDDDMAAVYFGHEA
jgi:3-hydroxyisobutyrate dehydrogenase